MFRRSIMSLMKEQNMTGPGRPGREDQTSLTALSAAKLGWDYAELLKSILRSAQPLRLLREIKIE
jgi:hypothetical protein